MTETSSRDPHDVPYPASLRIDYPDRPLNRLTTLLRLLTAIPALVILDLLSNASAVPGSGDSDSLSLHLVSAGGVLFLPTLLALLVRRRYPRWWFDWHLAFTRFTARVVAYLLLLRDELPALEDEQAVHLDLTYPDAPTELNRWLPLVKWLLALPHVLILALLTVVSVVCTVVAWFVILLTGRYPRSLFDFVVGIMRWGLRVQAYALLLITDRYPPFTLDE